MVPIHVPHRLASGSVAYWALEQDFFPSYSAFGYAVSLGSSHQGLITPLIIELIIHWQNFPLFFDGCWFRRRPFKPVST